MYAIADSSLLYHLVIGRETFCGAFVTGERSQSYKGASWLAPLYLVNERSLKIGFSVSIVSA
jgi:hypothetical protein